MIDLKESINKMPAKDAKKLAFYFQPYLESSPQSLSRMRGDWKKTLTAQVIKYIRRKGVVEELFLQTRGNFRALQRLIINTKES